jgi:MazG family protein
MDELKKLQTIADTLLGPNGCPWDREQTFLSLQPYFIEEAHELVEALDLDNKEHILEEAGDLFWVIVFLAKIAEKEGRFTLDDVIKEAATKLVRRHPHIFGDKKIKAIEEVKETWEKIKKEEKKIRKTPFEGIPPTLPLLAKAQKVIHRIGRDKKAKPVPFKSEEELKKKLLEIFEKADQTELSVESALRRLLLDLEKEHTKNS